MTTNGRKKFNIDRIIQLLLDSAKDKLNPKLADLSESELQTLCAKSREIIINQPCLLELPAPIKICGDIHGQFVDLVLILEFGGFPPDTNYLFLGNYVDFGPNSINCLCLLLAYKVKYPQKFFLLRGNHECASMNRKYGFYNECYKRYSEALWKSFVDIFNCLPIAAIVGEKIFCCHGGIAPGLRNMDQIRRIKRPIDVPDKGFICDLLWSDPIKDIANWGPSNRGVSFTFGNEAVAKFLNKFELQLICRGHQIVKDGYEFFADRRVVTIFSAPCFRNKFDNDASLLGVDETLKCSFQTLVRADKKR